jgi:8-oxo-dGTP pyrophosphatase MutT (NUDIX family)
MPPVSTPARIPIRDAAALVLLDDTNPDQPKVLLGKRNTGHVFATGKFVFPGGCVEREDARMNVFGTLAEHVEERLMRNVRAPSFSKARGIGLAAVRELAEETGLYLGSKEIGAPEKVPPLWQPFRQAGVFPTLDGIWFIARAITPPNHIRRFDTRFFAARTSLVAHKVKGVVHKNAELTKLVWASFAEAEALDLMDITRIILNDVRERLSVGLERNIPVPFHYMRAKQRIRNEI